MSNNINASLLGYYWFFYWSTEKYNSETYICNSILKRCLADRLAAKPTNRSQTWTSIQLKLKVVVDVYNYVIFLANIFK